MPSAGQAFNSVARLWQSARGAIVRSCEAMLTTVTYKVIWMYVTLRWIVYCATGLWGFGELAQNRRLEPGQWPVQVPSRTKRPKLIPGHIKYLGEFYYESWNDRRWPPTEKDYEADDEADEYPLR